MKAAYTYEDIKARCQMAFELIGNAEDVIFDNAKPILEGNESSIVWISPSARNKTEILSRTPAKVIVCDSVNDFAPEAITSRCFLTTANPRLFYLKIIDAFFKEKVEYGIHPTACVHPQAQVHENVSIGPMAYVGKSTIGKGSVIHGRCYIYDNVTIGKDVIIWAGAVIGSDGFGYAKNEAGTLEKFPHIGGVLIEDNVEIGANTCIDRGTLGNTHIKKNAKIDNLVHIAHNVIVGENAAVIANSMIGGSTIIGDNAWVAPSASLRDGITIGGGALLGMGSVITKNVPGSQTWAGNPAMPIEELKKLQLRWKEK